MDNCRILLTGDYWHDDFRQFVTRFTTPVTMVPQEQLGALDPASDFDLIVMAEARRGQMSREEVEGMQTKFPTSPMVSLLGCWCEGEERSGQPMPGVIRVYWHQWEGRYEEFLQALVQGELSDWSQPAAATRTDRIQNQVLTGPKSKAPRGIIAVSTRTRHAFEMISDGLSASNWNAFWLEQSNLPISSMPEFKAICIEADSVTEEIELRISTIKKAHPFVPIVAVLNFPRVNDAYDAKTMGIQRIVSKPFQLSDLNQAVNSLVGVADSEVA